MSKVILITGASSGLGEALAIHFTHKGYRVYGTSRNPGPEPRPYPMLALDLTKEDTIDAAVTEIINREGRIDILINNAGIGMAGPFEQAHLDNIRKVYETNLFGALKACQAVLPHMRGAGGGRIINISSISAVTGMPYRSIYCSSKASLETVTASLRMELAAFGIECCNIQAGDIRTAIASHRIMDFLENDKIYWPVFQRVKKTIDEEVDKGLPPEVVAHRIGRIVEARRLRKNYVVGKPLQRVSVVFQLLLPNRIFERLLMNYTGL